MDGEKGSGEHCLRCSHCANWKLGSELFPTVAARDCWQFVEAFLSLALEPQSRKLEHFAVRLLAICVRDSDAQGEQAGVVLLLHSLFP